MLLDTLHETLTTTIAIEGVTLFVSSCADVSLDDGQGAGEHRYVAHIERRDANSDRPMTIAFSVPLGMAASFWKVGDRSRDPNLPADWLGDIPVSLVNSAPMGCLLDAQDHCLMAFGYIPARGEIRMRYGVDEEHACFTVTLEVESPRACCDLMLVLDGSLLSDALRVLSTWMAKESDSFPVTQAACEPVFSTWYAYLQDVSQEQLVTEQPLIKKLGCSCIFVDDGWQRNARGRGYRGCGDWIPDPDKFPDLRGMVERFHAENVRTVLWIAPLLLGDLAEVYPRMIRYAPVRQDGPGQQMNLLDPRRAAVREFASESCARLMRDYALDGLKIDFLDVARAYQGQALENPEPGDLDDIGEAMNAMLSQIREVLLSQTMAAPIVEFRQPYSSPAIAPFSNVVRAADCPADALSNRVRTVDERLLVTGRIVHGDMLLWDTQAGPQACAQQLMASFFAVPQISVKPSTLGDQQFRACAFLLDLWRNHRNTILGGEFVPDSQMLNYPVVRATREGDAVIGVYDPKSVIRFDTDELRHATILNSTFEDSVFLELCARRGPVRLRARSYGCEGVLREENQCAFSPDAEGKVLCNLSVPAFGVLELDCDAPV
ncbi:glycoside hydrolase family 36 protein [Bifidobacterium sp.]|jgi:alpha-galactosidase|uniref:glycoside hydrolase family 36 protein n=1 Tax=Bifidobacterium sp. TaxID=41200 RepID=UPI0025C4D655|nr:glycoside hydrolase family 36 protein [Bifidobacterium sp.]MCH4209486.1 alpha-galactosidase [Bifidobacterium sp.]MCI1225262.1 alpha-galactosidase [Bifidobacterium sp.]